MLSSRSAITTRRHSEDRRQTRPRARAGDVRLRGVVFPRSRRAVLFGAALSQRHRRATGPAPGGALARSRHTRASAGLPCSAPCCSRAITCRARRAG
jgi:hypothetical protein